jgi:RNA polymerase sigma-70 factor (ECF subfamily)
LRDISKVKNWLFTTLHRNFLKGRRRQIRFPHQDVDDVIEQLPAISPAMADQLDASQVLVALSKVDDVYQAAVALFYLEDLPYKDIADILEVPLGTVKSRIARGIVQLRRLLTAGDPLEPATASARVTRRAIADEPGKDQDDFVSPLLTHCPT